MKFRFVWIGKTKNKNWRALQEEYLARLSHFVRCEIVEIKDSSRKTRASSTIWNACGATRKKSNCRKRVELAANNTNNTNKYLKIIRENSCYSRLKIL